jgi:glycosyltransferase involved in cell wall biosynthesis
MHVCLTCIELFGDSIYGGFGRSTLFIARELVKRGVRVSIVMPRRAADRPDRYEIEGIDVRQFPPNRPWTAIRLFRDCRADIYHSQDASTATLLAQIAAPGAAHVVTFRDPMDREDWRVETDHSRVPRRGFALYRFFIGNPLVTLAVRRADARYAAANFLIPKSASVFGLRKPPGFLPSPVDVPVTVSKAERPTVCWIGRWAGRKRVELFFELARACPDIDFIAVGAAPDAALDHALREAYGGIPNLRMTGVLDQFADPEWGAVLGQSWVLVNTSLREGLPTTFVEAAAYRCALLSFADPDGFASRFGRKVSADGLVNGLRGLLANDEWRRKGEEAFRFVSEIFATNLAMDAHLDAYEDALRVARARTTPEKGRG